MKPYPIALVVDFQFTIKPFSLSWPSYRISSLSLCISHLVLRSRRDEVPKKAERQLRYESRCPERDCPAPIGTGMSFAALQGSWMDLGCVSAIDSNWQTIWIADAHRDDDKRFVVPADEKLSAFLELESATCK